MSEEAGTVRSFVAFELPEDIQGWCQAAIERARRELGPNASAVRWTEPRGIHLTLKFLSQSPASFQYPPNGSRQSERRPAGSSIHRGIGSPRSRLVGVPRSQLPVLIGRLHAELTGQRPFNLEVGGLGVFPGPRAPRVAWLAVLGDLGALAACQRKVEAATIPLGFPGENRPFQPHLTLGRVRETATPEQRAAIGALPATWPSATSRSFPVTAVSLMQSHLGPGGARYSRLAEIPFG